MNVLVLGSGGRESAIALSLSKSPMLDELFVAPGNGGTSAIAQNVAALHIEDGYDVYDFVRAHEISLVVIGPEAPLVAGVADILRQQGVSVFGPDAQGAALEGSKTFCKEFMMRHGIPTAAYQSFDNYEEAKNYLDQIKAPIVIKADGLAAGKGVVVADTLEKAQEALADCFEGAFGKAGHRVVIEECMEGPECSLLAFVSNGKAICMPTAQDHKRAFDGDRGPNTGGMGAYSPVLLVSDEELAAMKEIMDKMAAATAKDFEYDYRGVLYGGFMLTENGPKIVEFNVRFGDPETQVVLPRLESDLLEIMCAIASGKPELVQPEWSSKWAVCVVLASGGYPGSYEKGKVILGLEEVAEMDEVEVMHAGTAVNFDEELITSGGRVLNVVGFGEDFGSARENAYRAVDCITYENKQYRGDIGKAAME